MLSVCFWFLCAKAAPSMKRRDLSFAVRSFTWHTKYFTRSPTQINQRMSSMTKKVANYADLDGQFNHFHWSTRWHVDRNATKKCRVAGTFNLTWGKRPSSEKVMADPVRNAGSSLILHIPDNKYYNSLVADESVIRWSQKAMLQHAWNGMTRISGGPHTDVKAGVLPPHVKAASS